MDLLAVNGIDGYTTYRLTVSLPATARNVCAVYGNDYNAMLVPAAYQHEMGAQRGGVNPLYFPFFPEVEFDSWVTVGATDASAFLGPITRFS